MRRATRTIATDSEQLRSARALIEDPDRWTQGAFARDERGKPTWPSDPSAVRWCALGACIKAGAIFGPFFQAGVLYPGEGPADINDAQGHTAVLAMLDRAIVAAEAEEAMA